MANKRGRPKKEFPPDLIQNIIYRYAKEQKTTGKIRYMDMYRFSKELFNNKEIDHNIGEFFWRKGEGRTAIDKANQVMKHDILSEIEEDESLVNTKDTVNKFFTGKKSDKEKLIGALKINEIKLQQYIKKCKRLEKELIEVRELLKKEKSKSSQYKDNANSYQETLFQWMELSMSKEIPLTNLLTVGKTRTPIVEELLTSMLSENPIETFDRINTLKSRSLASESTSVEDRILHLSSSKIKQKSVLDDIDF
ncbi:hypothetical protein [Domibacillus robiginosus]|uniref:hypothetical protein n=1 Tax=Domibacillus robiginosus TaxID=1071054 RepID=UPI00067A8BCA|nr:hypothetical protein [Domibacillus robiginosus]